MWRKASSVSFRFFVRTERIDTGAMPPLYVETKYELHAEAQVAAVLDAFRTLSRVRNTCKDCAAGPWWLARMCSPPLRYHEYDCMTCVDVEKSQLCVLPFIL